MPGTVLNALLFNNNNGYPFLVPYYVPGSVLVWIFFVSKFPETDTDTIPSPPLLFPSLPTPLFFH